MLHTGSSNDQRFSEEQSQSDREVFCGYIVNAKKIDVGQGFSLAGSDPKGSPYEKHVNLFMTLTIVRIFSKLGYTSVGKIYVDGTKIKGNASAKRTKDRAGFEKWLSEIEEEIATVLQEAETIDNQEAKKTTPAKWTLNKRHYRGNYQTVPT